MSTEATLAHTINCASLNGMGTYPTIGVISLNWNGFSWTEQMLHALLKNDYPGRVEILIVDNGSREQEGKRLKELFGDAITLRQHEKNEGFTGGNNLAITQLLENPVIAAVVLLNNDTIPDPHFLTALVDTWQETGAELVATTMRSLDNPDEIDNLGITLTRGLLPFNRKNENAPLFCPSGGCVLYSRHFIETLLQKDGYFFDPRFFAYAEDLDVGFRAREYGFKIAIATGAIVLHKGSASTAPMSDFAVGQTYRNLVWVLAKHLSLRAFLWWLPKIIAAHALLIGFHIMRGKPHVILRAYGRGIFKLPAFLRERKNCMTVRELRSCTHPGLFV
ncbi:MAG: glycosyltransferase family 2 protein [bacterium]|nr:glycosyltransferase family 2 protein [bacterium]